VLTLPYCADDIKATVGPWLDGVVLPKVESRACLNQMENLLAAAETAQGMAVGSLDLMPIIETGGRGGGGEKDCYRRQPHQAYGVWRRGLHAGSELRMER
jgi:hypothetical protein